MTSEECKLEMFETAKNGLGGASSMEAILRQAAVGLWQIAFQLALMNEANGLKTSK